ncbi:hypothetical protein D3C84_1005590 [compost metagenome]
MVAKPCSKANRTETPTPAPSPIQAEPETAAAAPLANAAASSLPSSAMLTTPERSQNIPAIAARMSGGAVRMVASSINIRVSNMVRLL